MDNLFAVAGQFIQQGRVTDIREFGNGNINDTFLVTLNGAEKKQLVLQRVNTRVFRQPKRVMRNMRIATEHLHQRLELSPLRTGRRWEVLRVLLTDDGNDHSIDADGSFWRAVSFIEDAESFDTITDSAHAQEVGYALGIFHTLLSDLPPEMLADTLEGFHITPRYLRHFDEVLAKNPAGKSPEIQYCVQFVRKRSAWAHVLEDARLQGRLPVRPIHGDPKVNNILIDTRTGLAVSIVDLDTIKPGLIHYDIGDCLRSGCNLLGEETGAWETVRFEVDLCRSILQSYLPLVRVFLTQYDYAYLFDALRLIAFELGLRFFTDYLESNVYFKVRQPEQNLARALVQFRLTESIESQETAIRSLIQAFK